jgi:hypothetical protein
MSDPSAGLRPRDFALLLLGAGQTPPRRRARDQQADRAGLALKRRVMEELVALDPESAALEASLFEIVDRLGAPFGPTRSVALLFLEEWTMAQTAPQWLDHLRDAADKSREAEGVRHGRQLPG